MPGAFPKRKYPITVIDALCCAVLDRGMTVRQARGLLAEGTLPSVQDITEPVGVYDMPQASAADYVSRERKKRQGATLSPLAQEQDLTQALDKGGRRVLSLWERELAKLEGQGGEIKEQRIKALNGLLDALKRLSDIIPKTPPAPKRGPARGKAADANGQPGFLHDLSKLDKASRPAVTTSDTRAAA